MNTKKGLVVVFLILALLLSGLMAAKPVYNLYRDITFYQKEQSAQAMEVKAFAEEQGLSIGEWPYDILELYENNPETRDFVMNYPFREEKKVDITSYSTETVPLFLQWDPMWGYEDYGSSCVAVTGCGPTSLAMVGYYLTGDFNMTPDRIAQFAQRTGYYAPGYGSSWTLISEGAPKLGLTATELPLVKSKLVKALEEGTPIILALGQGDFTSTGHYIVLTGMKDGAFQVNDPNSRVRSEKLWTYEELEDQIRNIWAIGLPE